VLEVLNLRETSDVDLVVSDAIYNHYRDEKKWPEYVQDNGKKVLSHDGYNLMHTWMGNSLKHLQQRSFEVEKVAFMNVEELIEAKRHLGRKKDLEDIMLLEGYLETPIEKTL
ncbi:MAG: sulfate transporter, partial [Candidatus Saccharimonas sp.]